MSWRVEVGRDAKKELARLPASAQKRVARAILSLEVDPCPSGCKKLRNRDGWRVRVGDYRILYFADKPARRINVGVIAHRKDIYRK
ncbi:MAG: type II toxin-antitoxin system RelE/ParE family toxin [Chthoniobacterales bacterium]|nr:type II toxin-antitoxin system RelE/ParE family toxin [Chthoniobacterales bacterium]